jgi:hypothetical protein
MACYDEDMEGKKLSFYVIVFHICGVKKLTVQWFLLP